MVYGLKCVCVFVTWNLFLYFFLTFEFQLQFGIFYDDDDDNGQSI